LRGRLAECRLTFSSTAGARATSPTPWPLWDPCPRPHQLPTPSPLPPAGAILWDFAAVMAVIAVVATLAGQVIIDAIVKKLGRASLLVIVLACFFGVATILTLYIVARDIISLVQQPALVGAHGQICLA